MYKIFQLGEQNRYVQVTYSIQIFVLTFYITTWTILWGPCANFLFEKRRRTTKKKTDRKMSHIFGPKLDIVSEPHMAVLILVPCSAVRFLKL